MTNYRIQFSDVWGFPLFHAYYWSKKPLIKTPNATQCALFSKTNWKPVLLNQHKALERLVPSHVTEENTRKDDDTKQAENVVREFDQAFLFLD